MATRTCRPRSRAGRRTSRRGWPDCSAAERPAESTADDRRGHPRTASGTFLASSGLVGEGAGQPWFFGCRLVLPMSACWGVGVEAEQFEELLLGGVQVGKDALGSGSA